MSNRHLYSTYADVLAHTLLIAFANLSFMVYFALEVIVKAWSVGSMKFFRSSSAHILEAAVALSCLVRCHRTSCCPRDVRVCLVDPADRALGHTRITGDLREVGTDELISSLDTSTNTAGIFN